MGGTLGSWNESNPNHVCWRYVIEFMMAYCHGQGSKPMASTRGPRSLLLVQPVACKVNHVERRGYLYFMYHSSDMDLLNELLDEIAEIVIPRGTPRETVDAHRGTIRHMISSRLQLMYLKTHNPYGPFLFSPANEELMAMIRAIYGDRVREDGEPQSDDRLPPSLEHPRQISGERDEGEEPPRRRYRGNRGRGSRGRGRGGGFRARGRDEESDEESNDSDEDEPGDTRMSAVEFMRLTERRLEQVCRKRESAMTSSRDLVPYMGFDYFVYHSLTAGEPVRHTHLATLAGGVPDMRRVRYLTDEDIEQWNHLLQASDATVIGRTMVMHGSIYSGTKPIPDNMASMCFKDIDFDPYGEVNRTIISRQQGDLLYMMTNVFTLDSALYAMLLYFTETTGLQPADVNAAIAKIAESEREELTAIVSPQTYRHHVVPEPSVSEIIAGVPRPDAVEVVGPSGVNGRISPAMATPWVMQSLTSPTLVSPFSGIDDTGNELAGRVLSRTSLSPETIRSMVDGMLGTNTAISGADIQGVVAVVERAAHKLRDSGASTRAIAEKLTDPMLSCMLSAAKGSGFGLTAFLRLNAAMTGGNTRFEGDSSNIPTQERDCVETVAGLGRFPSRVRIPITESARLLPPFAEVSRLIVATAEALKCDFKHMHAVIMFLYALDAHRLGNWGGPDHAPSGCLEGHSGDGKNFLVTGILGSILVHGTVNHLAHQSNLASTGGNGSIGTVEFKDEGGPGDVGVMGGSRISDTAKIIMHPPEASIGTGITKTAMTTDRVRTAIVHIGDKGTRHIVATDILRRVTYFMATNLAAIKSNDMWTRLRLFWIATDKIAVEDGRTASTLDMSASAVSKPTLRAMKTTMKQLHFMNSMANWMINCGIMEPPSMNTGRAVITMIARLVDWYIAVYFPPGKSGTRAMMSIVASATHACILDAIIHTYGYGIGGPNPAGRFHPAHLSSAAPMMVMDPVTAALVFASSDTQGHGVIWSMGTTFRRMVGINYNEAESIRDAVHPGMMQKSDEFTCIAPEEFDVDEWYDRFNELPLAKVVPTVEGIKQVPAPLKAMMMRNMGTRPFRMEVGGDRVPGFASYGPALAGNKPPTRGGESDEVPDDAHAGSPGGVSSDSEAAAYMAAMRKIVIKPHVRVHGQIDMQERRDYFVILGFFPTSMEPEDTVRRIIFLASKMRTYATRFVYMLEHYIYALNCLIKPCIPVQNSPGDYIPALKIGVGHDLYIHPCLMAAHPLTVHDAAVRVLNRMLPFEIDYWQTNYLLTNPGKPGSPTAGVPYAEGRRVLLRRGRFTHGSSTPRIDPAPPAAEHAQDEELSSIPEDRLTEQAGPIDIVDEIGQLARMCERFKSVMQFSAIHPSDTTRARAFSAVLSNVVRSYKMTYGGIRIDHIQRVVKWAPTPEEVAAVFEIYRRVIELSDRATEHIDANPENTTHIRDAMRRLMQTAKQGYIYHFIATGLVLHDIRKAGVTPTKMLIAWEEHVRESRARLGAILGPFSATTVEKYKEVLSNVHEPTEMIRIPAPPHIDEVVSKTAIAALENIISRRESAAEPAPSPPPAPRPAAKPSQPTRVVQRPVRVVVEPPVVDPAENMRILFARAMGGHALHGEELARPPAQPAVIIEEEPARPEAEAQRMEHEPEARPVEAPAPSVPVPTRVLSAAVFTKSRKRKAHGGNHASMDTMRIASAPLDPLGLDRYQYAVTGNPRTAEEELQSGYTRRHDERRNGTVAFIRMDPSMYEEEARKHILRSCKGDGVVEPGNVHLHCAMPRNTRLIKNAATLTHEAARRVKAAPDDVAVSQWLGCFFDEIEVRKRFIGSMGVDAQDSPYGQTVSRGYTEYVLANAGFEDTGVAEIFNRDVVIGRHGANKSEFVNAGRAVLSAARAMEADA